MESVSGYSGATKGGLEGAQAPPSLSWGRPAIPPDPMTFCTGWGGVRTPTAYRCLPRLAYRLTVRPEYYSTLAPNESLYCVLCQIKVRVLVQLTLTKILKIVATRWRILRLKMHHNRFRRAYSAPPDPLAGFGGLLLRRGEGRETWAPPA